MPLDVIDSLVKAIRRNEEWVGEIY
jgi:hypothetical protein